VNLLYREMRDEQVAYYGSIVQFDTVCAALCATGQYSCEVTLLQTLTDIRNDVVAHMSITAELAAKYRGSRKSAIVVHDGGFITFVLMLSFHLHMVSLWYTVVHMVSLSNLF